MYVKPIFRVLDRNNDLSVRHTSLVFANINPSYVELLLSIFM